MAIITRLTVKLIVAPILMLVIHFRLIVLVTENAFKNFVIRRIHVTGGAILPFAAMLAGINAEILSIVIKGRRRPRI
jgi:hypothetical protein